LQSYNHYLGKPDSISDDLDRYRGVNAAAIRDIANQYLAGDRGVELITMPAAGGAK